MMEINAKTKLLGLFGNPSRHSLSPLIQNHFLNNYKINCVYLSFEPPLKNLRDAFNGIKALEFIGINVTMPFKEEVYRLADRTEGVASVMKAVNTVKFLTGEESGEKIAVGFSTDGDGVIKSLEDKGFKWQGKKCLLLGAGGAAKSAAYAINQKPVRKIYVFDILPEKSASLANMINSAEQKIEILSSLKEIEKEYDSVDLIINCTPAGMDLEDGDRNRMLLPVPESWSLEGKYIFDMVYKPVKTTFLKKAEHENAEQTIQGIDMLVNQAAYSFHIWFGIMPEGKIIRRVKDIIMSSFLLNT